MQHDDRSPQVRTLTFPAHLSHLLDQPLVAWGLRCCLPTRPTGLASLALRVPQVAGLRPASLRPTSRCSPCLPLMIGATNLHKRLSLSSQRPCWAHKQVSRKQSFRDTAFLRLLASERDAARCCSTARSSTHGCGGSGNDVRGSKVGGSAHPPLRECNSRNRTNK